MKKSNQTIKANILSKVVIYVVLGMVVVMLSSCFMYMAEYCASFYTHSEFVNFIERYNSKNDGYVSTFISFDFDSNEAVADKQYAVGTVAKFNRYTHKTKIFDKYYDDLAVQIVLLLDGEDENNDVVRNAYQVVCRYSSSYSDFNFYQTDDFSYTKLDENNEKSKFPYNIHKSSYYNPDDLEYNYACTYNLNVNGIYVMEIAIASLEEEISHEKIDEILQILMDNIVIINTEEKE